MKKITLLLIFCSLFLSIKAAVLIDETFTAIPNPQSANTVETSGGWTVTNGATFGNCTRTTTAGGIKYPASGIEYINSQIGNTLSNQYTGITSGSSYATKQFSASGISSGTIYLSLILNLSQLGTNAQIIALCPDASAGRTVALWGGNVVSGSTYKLGLTRGSVSSTVIVYNSTTLNFGTNYLVVLKYDFSNSTASLFINPNIGGIESNETAWVTDNTSDNTKLPSSLSYIVQRGAGANRSVWTGSGMRLSTAWSDAVAAKSTATQLTSPTINTTTSVTSTGFTANWTPVSNATGYDLKTYMGNNLISTTNFSGQATSSGTITGLMSGITYTYKVIAKGNGSTYSDSELSTASENITTLDPYAVNSINTDFNDGSWGSNLPSTLTTNNYGSSTINGFELTASAVYNGNTKGIKGESHTNRIGIDKLSNGGKITFPTVNSLEQLEIHATAGTGGNSFLVKEFNATNNTWDLVSTCVYSQYTKNYGLDSIYTINISRTQPTKFRIENPSNGVINICQIITRTTAPTTLATPTVGTGASSVTNTAFTADWSSVLNADSYDVRVYKVNPTSPITFTQVTTTQSGNLISGLTPNTTYIYRIFANTNNSLYLDSYMSMPSEQFTTSNTFSIVSSTNISSLATINASSDITVNGGTLTIDANTDVNSITVAPGAKVSLADTKTLSGTLVLQSNNSGNATFIDENPTGSVVSATVQQHLTSGRNWYLSIPVGLANRSDFSSAGTLVRYYEPTGQWYTQTSDSVINPMRGYISASTSSTGTISFNGTLNSGEKYIDLTRTASVAKTGYNLVGNPYPSFVSWEAATKTNLEPTIWLRSRNAGNTAYIFDTYNATTHVGTGLNGSELTTYIPPMQAFWVRVAEGFTTGRLTLNNTMRSHGSGSNKLKAPATTEQQLVRLRVSNGTNEDESILVFNKNASNGFDNFDSQKMSNNEPALPEIFTLCDNKELVINGMSQFNTNTEIELGFRTGETNNFTIKASELANFDNKTRIVLKDKTLNTETDLTDGAIYEFSSDKVNTTGRFAILFKSPETVTGTKHTNSNVLICTNNNNQLLVNHANGNTITVYNSVGKLIETKKISSDSETLNSNLQPGIYLVKVNTSNDTVSRKIRVH